MAHNWRPYRGNNLGYREDNTQDHTPGCGARRDKDTEEKQHRSVRESPESLRRDIEALRRDLGATRAWCLGLEEELARLRAMLQPTDRG